MKYLKINAQLIIPLTEIKLHFIAAQGPGGQNVNKVATAVQLRFHVLQSASLTDAVRVRLIQLNKNRMTAEGELIIKANRYRTQERNKQDALQRLIHLLFAACIVPKVRRKTKVKRAEIEKRLKNKKAQGQKKQLRKNFSE